MPTKEEIEEELNERLDTEIEWSELKSKDLNKIEEMIDNGELIDKLLRHMVSKYGREEVDRRIKDWKPGDLIRRMM